MAYYWVSRRRYKGRHQKLIEPNRRIGLLLCATLLMYYTSFKKSKKTICTNAKECALVLSSGVLLGENLGDSINKYDRIVRINLAPTKGYEKDVGSRTDVIVLGAYEIRNILRNTGNLSEKFINAEIAIIRPLNGYTYEEIMAIRYVSASNGLITRLFVGHEEPALKVLNGISETYRMTSTGFFGLLSISPFCKSIRVFGLGYDPDAPYSYYHPSRLSMHEAFSTYFGAGNHDLMIEQSLIRNWTRETALSADNNSVFLDLDVAKIRDISPNPIKFEVSPLLQ